MISYKNHSKNCHNRKGCFDLRGLVGFPKEPFRNGSKLKTLFNLYGLVGFPTKTIQKRVETEEVASISVVW